MRNIFISLTLLLTFNLSFGQKFSVSYSPEVYDKPFTGKVIVYLSKNSKQPKDQMVVFGNFPCFSVSVENVQPGKSIIVDDHAVSYPTTLSNIERGQYYIQAVWDRNLGGRDLSKSPGNLFSQAQKINLTKDTQITLQITATEIIPNYPAFIETENVKKIEVTSNLLSQFHDRPISLRGAVVLPKNYITGEQDQKYPVLYYVLGYGGDYQRLSGRSDISPALDSIPVIKVFLDGNCPLGHSVYANSDNNGPWGDALIQEFIPALEKQFRTNGARLLHGHSSGGWSVLWLQTQYPNFFTACWSSSPDPVDFRNFQKINLYEDDNMYYTADSTLRLLGTVAGVIPWGTMKSGYQMENVVYRGEQLHSFDAVFSKKDNRGLPRPICHTNTGQIDPTVVEEWKRYDIALRLRKNWNKLKTDLYGKVRISVGNEDNFLLNHSVASLESQMKELNSSFEFGYYPGDHFTVFTDAYETDGTTFLVRKYLEWVEDNQ